MSRAGATRHAAKRDSNEPEIVAALLVAGCLVESLSKRGVPDLLVWSPFRQRLLLLEVKDGSRVPSARRLTDDQQLFHARWQAAPIFTVASVAQAYEAVGVPSERGTS